MDEIKAQELYDFFNKEGYDLGDFNNFTSALEDEIKRKELYDFFNKEGYDVGSLDNFNLKKKDPSEVSTSPTEGGESVSGGTEALDQSLQDRLDQGHIDLSTFTTGTDQEAMEQSTIAEKTRIYEAYGIDYNEYNDLKEKREKLEQEKIEYQDNLLRTRFLMLPGTEVKKVDGELKYYRPAGDIGTIESIRAITSGQTYEEYTASKPEIYEKVEISREDAIKYTESEESFGMSFLTDAADFLIGSLSEEGTRTARDQESILSDIGDTDSRINEISDQAIQAEEYYNTRMVNSLMAQGYKGDRLNQLIENAGIDSEYVKSGLFKINGEDSSAANIEDKMYDRDFIDGLQDGSIKVSIDPSMAETEYGRYIQNAIAIQSNSGSEISDILDEFIAGGLGSVAGVLEVGESVEGLIPGTDYGEKGGVMARIPDDVAKQIRMAQRMYKYPGFMEALRAGEFKDAAYLLGRGIAGSGIQISAMAIAKYYGVDPKITMALMGISAGGQKSLTLKEMRRANKAEELRIKESEKYQNATPEEQESMLSHLTFNMSDFEIALNSTLSGGFEMLFEIPTYQMINGVQEILKRAPKYTAKEVADQVTKGALRDVLGEGLSEAGTEISTMIVDHVTGAGTPESFDAIVNQVGNSFSTGIGMGTGIKTIGATTAVGVSAYNSIKGTDLTNKIVATYQTVNEDGSLGEVKELTGAQYREWRKDPNNIAGEILGDIKVNRYNSDIADAVEDIANTNSEDVLEANNDVNEAGSEANSLLNEIEAEMKGEGASVPSGKIAKVKGLLNRMNDIIKETGAKGIQDLKGLNAKLNKITGDAGISLNDNVANQNTDNANIQSTETITEIQTQDQAKAVDKALKQGKDPSVILSQDGIGVSKDGSSVSENNITVGKFESKDAAQKALDKFNKQNSKASVEERRHAEVQKKNNKAFNKVDKKNLDEVSQEEVGGDYNIISASVKGLDDASNEQRNNKLEKVLKKKGLKYKKVQVIEDGVSKTSFMVEGMDSSSALDLAVGFGQKSITSSKDGILHRDGTVESLDGNVYFGPNARNGAKVVVMNVGGRKVSMRLGTNKASYSKDFSSENIDDINPFIENLPQNQKKILGHVLRFFSNVKGLKVRVVKTTSAMKRQLEAEGYPADQINSVASNRAFYRGSDGTMVLNLENMNLNTPFHEITHPLVDFIKRENPDLYSRIEQMVQKAESNIPGSPFKKRWYKNGKRQSGSYMDWARANYPGKSSSLQVEEAFAEMIGDAAANQFMKDNSKIKQLKDFIAEILEYFNLPTNFLKDKDIVDLRLDDIKDIGQLRGDLGAVLAKGKGVSVGGVDFNVSETQETVGVEVMDDIRPQVQENDGFTGGRNQYGRFNVIPSSEYVTATPSDLSSKKISKLSTKGNWSIITGTVEADGKYDNDVNVSNNARLYRELVSEFGAENVVETQGVYLKKDQGPSYFISGITENRAMQIGKNFNQEGVLTRRGNIFTDGSGMNPASKKVFVGKKALAQDGSSTTPDGVTFSLDIDFKTKVPLSDGIRPQVLSGEANTITEDQLTLLKSTYSEIESKYPDIQIDEGMIKMYHYSNMELDVVDPRSAVMNSYSKQEYRTWGRSRVFFYTDPNIKEGVVGGHYKNTTVFPIDRLYPLTEDPLGLSEVAREVIEVKRNSGDKTQATITLDATTLESADMAISKFRSLTKDMGLYEVIDFGEVTENYRYKKNEDGTFDRAGVENISFTATYPIDSENIDSLIGETFDRTFFQKISPRTQPINTFEEVAKVAESLGFQGFIYDHVGGKTVSSWHPVEILDDRFQVNDQDQNDVYVSGLGAIMWDLTKPIIDADYALGEWATKVKDKDRPYPIRATQLFAKPKGMHSNAEIKEMVVLSRGKLDEQMFIANKNQKNLKRVVKEEIKRIKAKPEYQQATAQQQEAMLSNLTPEGLNELIGDVNKIKGLMPEQSKLRQALLQVRDHIDTLSTYLYENGLVSGPMRYTIEGNLGFYLTRAYKKYESGSWRQTDQEVIRRAELFIANQLMGKPKNMSKEDAMVRAKQMVDNLIKDKISITSFKRNTGIGSSMTRVNDIFKERNENLPKEIRDLLGEINEPFENYVNTISKLARTATSHQLYEDLIQMGMGKFIADPNIDDDKTSQVPEIGNKLEGKKWGPLEGKFVDNEMFAMLNAYESNALFDSMAYKVWMTLVYGSKKFATVHNPGTHAVNLIGNTFFSLANGHVNPIKFYDAARTAIGEITNLSGKEREAFYQELVSLGVVSSSASLAEIVQIGQDISAGRDVTSFLDKMNQGKVKKVATIPLRALRSLDSMATKAYQAEDDVFKIFGFMTEKARYMDAGMSEAEATAIAARNTRNTYPNYDMVPSIVRAIGRSPIIGTFVAFQSEAIRCTKNALKLSLDEMGSNNPKVKLMGAKRMAFSLSALTFVETLTATAMSMLFGSGDDDEDDDIETYGLRHLTAPWDKDSKLTPIEKGYITPGHEAYNGKNNGNAYVQYMNVSRLSGGGIIKDMLRVGFSDMNTPDKENAILRITKTLATTFLSQDMALEKILEVKENRGNKVYNPTDDFTKIISDIAMYVGKDLGPGVIKRAKAINDSMKEHSEKITYHEILATVGLRISTIDVNKALYFRARDLYSDMRSRSESQGYDLRVKDLSLPNALRPGTDTFDPKMSLYFNNLVDVVATASNYGVGLSIGDNNCRDILRQAGVPSHVIDKVINNVYNMEKGKDSLLIMYK